MIEVRTALGNIIGSEEKDSVVFRGIPYALPPIQKRRFKAPEAIAKYEKTINATSFKYKAMQEKYNKTSFYYKEFHQNEDVWDSEDCLYLNIYTPRDFEDKQLPVAIWIHGGTFDHGSGSEKEFDGLAYNKHGVILVTINYRLGALGFLVADDGKEQVNGNLGLLDQIMAINWVKANIECFGGDPNNITLFGQSAGCMSVQYLMSSKYSKDLFHKAILQSGGGYRTPFMNAQPSIEEMLPYGQALLEELKVTSIEEARNCSASQIITAQSALKAKFDPRKILFMPVVDDDILSDTCDNIIDKKELNNIPIMIGSCSNEFGMNIVTKGLVNASASFALKLAEMGNEQVYCYYFDRDLPGDDAKAFHSSELWYTFNTLARCWRPFEEADYTLSEIMVAYWSSFMNHGKPGMNGLLEWTPYYLNNEHMVFNVEYGMKNVL